MGLYIFIKMYQPVSFVINYLMVTYMRKLEFEVKSYLIYNILFIG